METRLTCGIVHLTKPWISLLEQLGVTFEEISLPLSPQSFASYSCIICNQHIHESNATTLGRYLCSGGAILDIGFCITQFIGGTVSTRYCTSLFSDQNTLFPPLGTIDVHGLLRVHSHAHLLNGCVSLTKVDAGIIAFCGIDPNTLLTDTRSQFKQFYGEKPRFASEQVSTVSKSEICRLFFYLLRSCHTARNIPFVHSWFFPKQKRSCILFRIDSDYGKKEQVESYASCCLRNKINPTWFLHVEAHLSFLDLFKTFVGHEIATHCFKHFFNTRNNQDNISKAQQTLQDQQIQSFGYAAPYGLWNPQLQSILETKEFIYSSEFSALYDGLPLYTTTNDSKSTVLQVPVHPICIGSLCTARQSDTQILSYFTRYINYCLMHCMPIALYDHVTHSKIDIMNALFSSLSSQDIPSLTFLEYAQFWKKRVTDTFIAIYNKNGSLSIQRKDRNKNDTDTSFCVWHSDTQFSLVTSCDKMPLSTILTQSIAYDFSYHKDTLINTRKISINFVKRSLLTSLLWRKKS